MTHRRVGGVSLLIVLLLPGALGPWRDWRGAGATRCAVLYCCRQQCWRSEIHHHHIGTARSRPDHRLIRLIIRAYSSMTSTLSHQCLLSDPERDPPPSSCSRLRT